MKDIVDLLNERIDDLLNERIDALSTNQDYIVKLEIENNLLKGEVKEAQTVATTALKRELDLKKENERLRPDAERYRWLRERCESNTGLQLVIAKVGEWNLESWSWDNPDAVIDAAREGK